MYGHPVGVNYKGSDVYKTRLGALLTLLTYLVIGTYAGFKIVKLVTRDDPEKASLIEVLNMNGPEAGISFEEGQFDFAVAFSDSSEYNLDGDSVEFKTAELPPQVGKYIIFKTAKDKDGYKTETLKDIAQPCDFENHFKFFDQNQEGANSTADVLKHAACFDKSKVSLKGNFLSTKYESITISLILCSPEERNDCLSEEEIHSFFLTKTLILLYSSNYVDFTDYERPVKS